MNISFQTELGFDGLRSHETFAPVMINSKSATELFLAFCFLHLSKQSSD